MRFVRLYMYSDCLAIFMPVRTKKPSVKPKAILGTSKTDACIPVDIMTKGKKNTQNEKGITRRQIGKRDQSETLRERR